MCGKLQTLLDCDSQLASLPLVVSSRNRFSALYLWIVAVPKNIARFRALMRASPVSTPQSPNIVEGFFSYYSLPPSGTQSFTHHVSSLPRTTKYTAILRDKVWRALSRAAGFFLHQETSGVRCLGACPLHHPRIQVPSLPERESAPAAARLVHSAILQEVDRC